MNVEETVENAATQISAAVGDRMANPRQVIARYTAAMAVNHSDWIGKTLSWARHERARLALAKRLQCEATEDRAGLLFKFSEECNAVPDHEEYGHVEKEVSRIRKLLSDPRTAGLSGMALCTIFEAANHSLIPDLTRLAEGLRPEGRSYTDACRKTAAAHYKSLLPALKFEAREMYPNPEYILRDAADRAIILIARIYA